MSSGFMRSVPITLFCLASFKAQGVLSSGRREGYKKNDFGDSGSLQRHTRARHMPGKAAQATSDAQKEVEGEDMATTTRSQGWGELSSPELSGKQFSARLFAIRRDAAMWLCSPPLTRHHTSLCTGPIGGYYR